MPVNAYLVNELMHWYGSDYSMPVNIRSHPLWLMNRMKNITDEAAGLLGIIGEEEIFYLDGLTEISDVGAERLSKYHGTLYLRGLTELSPSSAKFLAENRRKRVHLSEKINIPHDVRKMCNDGNVTFHSKCITSLLPCASDVPPFGVQCDGGRYCRDPNETSNPIISDDLGPGIEDLIAENLDD